MAFKLERQRGHLLPFSIPTDNYQTYNHNDMPFFLLDRSLFSCFHIFHNSHTYWQILLWFNQEHLKSYPKEAVISCFDFTLSQDNHNWDQMFLYLGICNLKKVMMQPEYPYFLHKEILVPIIIDIRNGKTSVFYFSFRFL